MMKCKGHHCGKPETCKCRKKLFFCHQLAMKREAEVKQREMMAATAGRLEPVNVPVIWVLGGPGCGKGTQCVKIVEKYAFTHISTGDLLRAEVASGSEKGKHLETLMKEGKLVSNDDVLQLLECAIHKTSKNSTGFLIDGYPREKDQGSAFEKYIAPVDLVLLFDCTDETMIARILQRASESQEVRADDNEQTIKCRIDTFRKNAEEINRQYTSKTVTINAERSVDEIFADVVKAIDEVVERKKPERAAAKAI